MKLKRKEYNSDIKFSNNWKVGSLKFYEYENRKFFSIKRKIGHVYKFDL